MPAPCEVSAILLSPAASISLLSPKSVIFTLPLASNRMLPGFKS